MKQNPKNDDDYTYALPEEHRRRHAFCLYVYRNLAQMLKQHNATRAHRIVSETLRDIAGGHGQILSEIEVIRFLRDNAFNHEYRHHLLSNLSLALIADMLRYLHQSLHALADGNLSVGLTLLRKPIKENLLFLAWILADEDGFLGRFAEKNYESLNGVISKDRAQEIFEKTIPLLVTPDYFDVTQLCEAIYSKQFQDGLEPLWQRSAHLITSQGNLLKTQDYSINLIFEDAIGSPYFGIVYQWIPVIFLLASQVAPECMRLAFKFNETTYSHHIVSTIGYFETLGYLETDVSVVAQMISHAFSRFLKCDSCGYKLEILESSGSLLYEHEQLECSQCGCLTQVPLYWLLKISKIRASRNGIQVEDVTQ